MAWQPAENRYETMVYNRCGRSGLKLPAISLGLWHNFGGDTPHETKRAICRTAFDLGITHFDLANNYGPPPGSAETAFGEILRTDFAGLRDELIISSKAGYDMWPGPYGEWGSRKYLLASLDQSLKRMGLDYVDIFYSHRFDPDTPLEETMVALDHAVRSGKALYAGISSYNSQRTREAAAILRELGTPLPHPPAELFDDQPLGRGRRAARYAGGARHRLDRLLAAGAGHADRRNISSGIPEGSRAAQGKSLQPGLHQRADASTNIRALNEHRREARPDAGADGARLGAARRPHHHGADRRQPARAGRGLRRRGEEPRFHRRGAGRDRQLCARGRHQTWAASAERKGRPQEEVVGRWVPPRQPSAKGSLRSRGPAYPLPQGERIGRPA